MLFLILLETFRRRKRRVAVAILAVAVGAALVAALFQTSSGITERMAKELRAYGANILVTPAAQGLQIDLGGVSYSPAGSPDAIPTGIGTPVGDAIGSSDEYIDESHLPKLKTIFWRNNIVGFAPYLSLPVSVGEGGGKAVLTGTWFEKEFSLPPGTRLTIGTGKEGLLPDLSVYKTGTKAIAPWWKVEGRWARDEELGEAMVGSELAKRLGLRIGADMVVEYGGRSRTLKVVGIVEAGGWEDDQIFVGLPLAQQLSGIASGASKVLVSAMALPKEKLAPDIRDKRPEEMSPEEYDKWYCSPIIEAIATQIQEVIPGGEARPIRQFTEAESTFAMKIELIMVVLTLVALASSALAVMATMATSVMERRGEIGLMKAIGADRVQIALIFFTEASLMGLLGGTIGYLAGTQLSNFIAAVVFATSVPLVPVALPATLVLALGVALLGSALPVYRASSTEPATTLREGLRV